jgi:hypothetical protein
MKGKQAMTPTERTRKRRERLQDDGGRIIQVALTHDTAGKLERLVEAHGSITEAITYAIEASTPSETEVALSKLRR